ncbi:MAG: hypothetical protein K1X78_26870 [Verrucomicrobiaceae bacterium]|nr:hypothetical protein [Verrucomicrobiaceae bacterium]
MRQPLAICLLILTAGLAVSNSVAQANSPYQVTTLPVWLRGAAHLLPPVSEASLAAVRKAGMNLWLDDTDIFRPSAEQVEAAHMVRRIGDEAAKALIWMYADAYPPPDLGPVKLERFKHFVLLDLRHDLDAMQWLLPLLRLRLKWARAELEAGSIDRSGLTEEEFAAISVVLTDRGSDEDIQGFFGLEDSLRLSQTELGRSLWPMDVTPQQRWDEAMRTRTSARGRTIRFADRRDWVEESPPTSSVSSEPRAGSGSAPATATPVPKTGDARTANPSGQYPGRYLAIVVGICIFLIFAMLKLRR